MGFIKTGLKIAVLAGFFGLGYSTARDNYTTPNYRISEGDMLIYQPNGKQISLCYELGSVLPCDINYVGDALITRANAYNERRNGQNTISKFNSLESILYSITPKPGGINNETSIKTSIKNNFN